MEKKDTENDETIDRLMAKHSQELGELKYKAQEADSKRTEASAELDRLRSQLSTQADAQDLKEQLSQLETQLAASTRSCRESQDDNERLREENQSVGS